MMEKYKVILVDDHKIFREGLKMLLGLLPNIEVIAEASNGFEFLKILNENKTPDFVFMDINMKGMDGIEASQKALELYPDLKIIALTSFDDEAYFNQMTDIGVKGYLLKNSVKEDFEKAITKIALGYNYYSDELITKLTRKMEMLERNRKIERKVEEMFSPEEKLLIKYICEGLTNKQIAEVMHLSARTIEAHRAKLLEKTGTNNSVALAVYAVSRKLVDTNPDVSI